MFYGVKQKKNQTKTSLGRQRTNPTKTDQTS